jgi:PTS system nitrogen regulatory IIA component
LRAFTIRKKVSAATSSWLGTVSGEASTSTSTIGDAARLFGKFVPDSPIGAVETALLARERLGSTGLGAGFALPHARIDGLDAYFGMVFRLAKPIDFDAIDGKPIDMAFVLLIPSETSTPHVAALAAISRKFRDSTVAANLRKAKTQAGAFGLLADA